ncbi:MAG: 4Fe-4S binding protein, partial [Anaerolineae bacterium]|nr:4Fe-4S binding protein [Anaerolineae bacterium]
VPQNAIFATKRLPCRYAIVITVEMDKAAIDMAPSFETFLEVAKGYRRLAAISNWVARRLRRAGFAGYPGTALGGLTDYPHLAELAGLGAIGYHGLLISPDGGARLRINTIYTNIENLPLAPLGDHAWVRDFCSRCRRCVRECPVDAIYDQPRPRADGGMRCIEHDTCREYFDRNFGCAVCLAVCPFSVKGYASIKSRFMGNPDAPRFTIP